MSPDQPALYRMRARWSLEQARRHPRGARSALGDLREAIKRERPKTARCSATLHAEVARLLLEDKRFRRGTVRKRRVACESTPRTPWCSASKIVALLELKRFDEAVAACEAYLTAGHKSPELLGLRGLAKSKRHDFAARSRITRWPWPRGRGMPCCTRVEAGLTW